MWTPPHPELQNGVIIHYVLCIREYGPNFACGRTTQVLESSDMSFTYGGLSPNREYVVVIRAATIVGLGPPAFVQKTKGQCDLPVLHRGDQIGDDGFTASGYLGSGYAPHHARIDSDPPWCDSRLKNNTFVQVDFGGPLRVIGVATRRDDEHWKSWVSSYEVMYSLNNVSWQYVNVSGNTIIDGNADTIQGKMVTYFIDEPVLTRFIRFRVLSFAGLHQCMGVQIFGCAPAVKPTATVLHKTAWSIQVSWLPLPLEMDNGMSFGYKICHKLSSSDERRCAYVGQNTTSYNITGLIPFTHYDIEISVGTVAGYGTPVLLWDETCEAVLSGPPRDFHVLKITATSIKLSWSNPHTSHLNGIIMFYGICYQEASLETDCQNVLTLSGTSLQYEITDGLRPYTEYIVVAMAATKVPGWSPKAVLYGTTLPAAPSGPPTSLFAIRVAARILQIFWRPPESKKQNGVIIGYRLCIKEKHATAPCTNYVTLPENEMNMHSVTGLKPHTSYIIHVEAQTSLGYGPGESLNYRTGEAAPSAPPRVEIKSTSSVWMEITWSPPEIENQNGVIALYEVEVYEELAGSRVERIARYLMRAHTTSWKISGLSPGTHYILQVRAGTAVGFGPAVIIYKCSEGHPMHVHAHAGESTDHIHKEKLSTDDVTGGSILLLALVAGVVFSILWNKGILPNTRTRRLKLELRKEKERREINEISESSGTETADAESRDSELDDDEDVPCSVEPKGTSPTDIAITETAHNSEEPRASQPNLTIQNT
ncbi:protein sidekick-1-like [Dendronephthya gigantea]|uniref:protein sidekick-1-like n=1 Tax=Dendronephthya gigantea TaxID=151771 RepID=UPI00106D12BA|nr:protein sidekick-1-like [Dendronephthya gigantea]